MTELGCGCGVVGSRQTSGVARWRLLTRRAWHGWCVVWAVVTLPERAVAVLLLVTCMLVCWWSGQAGAGLGALRSPAVRNLP